MEQKISVGAVSYLNTKPLVYGFQHGMMQDEITLVTDYPSNIANALLTNTIDIGLVPVAILNQMPEWHIVGNHCISCNGPVASVCIFSEVPIEEISTLFLDYQSRTSVQLAQVLMKEYWQIKPDLVPAPMNFIEQIKGQTAAVVIGDRALANLTKFPYVYDLGEIWQLHTGLPFVFAAWISAKKMTDEFEHQFDAANAVGLQQLEQVVSQNPYPFFDLRRYYTQHIQFQLNQTKKEALSLFLQKIKSL